MISAPGSIWGQWKDRVDNGVWELTGSTAPVNGTSGTGVNFAGPGSIYVNIASGLRYLNTGTKASPTWTSITVLAGMTEAEKEWKKNHPEEEEKKEVKSKKEEKEEEKKKTAAEEFLEKKEEK